MVDMVDSCERNNHLGYPHEIEMQHTISRKGCGHFSAMIQVRFMWSSGACVDLEILVYIVLLHDYINCSHTNCSTVDIPGTPFDTHCKQQISLQCPVCPERECRYWFRKMDCHIRQ